MLTFFGRGKSSSSSFLLLLLLLLLLAKEMPSIYFKNGDSLGGQLVQPSDRLGGMGAWLAAVAGGR